MAIRPYLDRFPQLGARAYVDDAATVIGDVALGDDASVWPGTVIRGDVNFVRIGARTNVQDGTVIHVSHDGPHAKLGGFATRIGDDVTIGHKAVIHACVIEDAVLIGMGAIVLDGAVVRKHGFVGAGTVVPPGKVGGLVEAPRLQRELAGQQRLSARPSAAGTAPVRKPRPSGL